VSRSRPPQRSRFGSVELRLVAGAPVTPLFAGIRRNIISATTSWTAAGSRSFRAAAPR
jgi:hypothetical protein